MAVEQLLVRLQLDAQQYKREARSAAQSTGQISQSAKTAGTETGKIGGQMGAVAATAKFALAGAATAAVVGFAKDSVRAASDLQESLNAVNVVFGESADGIHAIGEESADSFGLAQSSFNEFAVRFSAFAKNIAQEEGREVVDVVGEMTGRIADFASVHNLSLEEAARVAQSTLAGETEVFRKFGGDVSAAAVQAEGLALGLSGVGDELTEGEKQLVRYRLFMKQTDDTAGDFKNTQDDLANATRTFNANLEDFKALLGGVATGEAAEFIQVGNDVLTVLEGLVNLGSKDIAGPFDEIFGFLQNVASFPRDALFNVIEWVADLADGSADAALTSKDFADHAADLEGELAALHGTTRDTADVTDDAAEAFKGTKLQAQDAAEAIEAYDDAFRRLTDPVFRAIDDQRRLAEAFATYDEVVSDAESTTADQEEALFGLLEAQREVNSSAAALPETLGKSEQAFADLAEQLGLDNDQLAIIKERLDALDGTTARAELEVFFKAGGNQSAMDAIASGTGTRRGGIVFRQHGGSLDARQPAIVGERGPELFVPQSSGMVISNADVQRLIGGLQSSTNNYTYNTTLQRSGDYNVDAQLLGAVESIRRRMETR